MNNKKLIRNIVIGVLVIGILAGALVWVNSIPDEKPETNSSVMEEASKIKVFTADIEDVKSVTVENSEKYTIVKNNESYSILGKENHKFENVSLEISVESFLNIEANKDVTEEEILFEKEASAIVYLKDGSQHELILGNNIVGSDERFLKYNEKTYVVSPLYTTYFSVSSDYFRPTNLANVSNSIVSLKIYENGKELVSFRQANEDDQEFFNYGAGLVMTYPQFLAVSEDRVTGFFEIFKNGYSIDALSFVDDDIKNKGKYGIGNKTIVITDSVKETKIAFGNKDENGNIYAVVNDGNVIVTLDDTIYNEIDAYTPDVLMSKLTHIYDIQKIDEITFKTPNESYTLSKTGEEDNYSYFINKEAYDEEKFKEIYREIIGITSDKIAYNGSYKNSEYTVLVKLSGGKEDVWEYKPYNERNYVLSLNGEPKYICLKKKLEIALSNIKNIMNK